MAIAFKLEPAAVVLEVKLPPRQRRLLPSARDWWAVFGGRQAHLQSGSRVSQTNLLGQLRGTRKRNSLTIASSVTTSGDEYSLNTQSSTRRDLLAQVILVATLAVDSQADAERIRRNLAAEVFPTLLLRILRQQATESSGMAGMIEYAPADLTIKDVVFVY
jgi:hypothetical protein